jgi:Zn-dependent M28 family amino/carboxypeptidase
VVVQLARTLRALRRPESAPEIRFVLFDGEEEPAGCEPFEACGIRGSKAYVRRHPGAIREMILLDYVGEKGLRIPREGNSDMAMWARLRAAARRVGAQATFPDAVGDPLIDDHVPFLRAGIPAIDLIDFDYPHRDTLRDTVDKTSPRSLDAVGETVVEMVLNAR